MNAIINNLTELNNIQRIHFIVLLKQCIKIIISTKVLTTQIKLTTQYMIIIKDLTEIAGNQTLISNARFLKYFKFFIIKHTTRGFIFPTTYEALLLELIQILECSCMSLPTQISTL